MLAAALDAAGKFLAAGERDSGRLLACVREEIARAPRAELDYAELRDPESLEEAPARLEAPTLLALAVRMAPRGDGSESVRLIDNRILRPG